MCVCIFLSRALIDFWSWSAFVTCTYGANAGFRKLESPKYSRTQSSPSPFKLFLLLYPTGLKPKTYSQIAECYVFGIWREESCRGKASKKSFSSSFFFFFRDQKKRVFFSKENCKIYLKINKELLGNNYTITYDCILLHVHLAFWVLRNNTNLSCLMPNSLIGTYCILAWNASKVPEYPIQYLLVLFIMINSEKTN